MARLFHAYRGRVHRLPFTADDLAPVLAPFGSSRMLPADAYRSPDVLAWERANLFDGGWVCVGRMGDVGSPGAQRAIDVGGSSVLVACDGRGDVRTFANVCRHRGHELLACGAEAMRGVIQCPYHAWSYELDGALRLAPRFESVPNFDASTLGLVELRSATWGGWLFVNARGDAPSFDEHIGALPDLVGAYECERLVIAATHHYELAANWKLACENYHECYHCPLIHPELCRVTDPRSGDNLDWRGASIVGGTMGLAPHAVTMSIDGTSPLAPFPLLSDEQRRQVVYVGLFANLLLSLHPDYVMTHRLVPIAPDRTHVECQWLFAPDAVASPGFDPSFAVDFWDLTNRQDWAAVESVQRSMTSPAYVPGLLAESEDAVHHFVTMVARAYERGVTRPDA
jgi:glycine betaine catabolism A